MCFEDTVLLHGTELWGICSLPGNLTLQCFGQKNTYPPQGEVKGTQISNIPSIAMCRAQMLSI